MNVERLWSRDGTHTLRWSGTPGDIAEALTRARTSGVLREYRIERRGPLTTVVVTLYLTTPPRVELSARALPAWRGDHIEALLSALRGVSSGLVAGVLATLAVLSVVAWAVHRTVTGTAGWVGENPALVVALVLTALVAAGVWLGLKFTGRGAHHCPGCPHHK